MIFPVVVVTYARQVGVGTPVAKLLAPLLTRIGLLTILVGEILYLTIRFDAQGLVNTASPWLRLVAWSPQYLRLAITISVIFLLLHTRRLSAGVLPQRPAMSPRVRLAFEHARKLLEDGAFNHSEPGPYRIFTVYSVAWPTM